MAEPICFSTVFFCKTFLQLMVCVNSGKKNVVVRACYLGLILSLRKEQYLRWVYLNYFEWQILNYGITLI